MASIQPLIDDLVIGIKNSAEKRSAMCLIPFTLNSHAK
jgi:hypothetical protein